MNNQKNEEFQDEQAVWSPSDLMLSSMLEDFIGETEPPDLKARILASLNKATLEDGRSIQAAPENARCSSNELDEAVRAASQEIKNGYGTIISESVENPVLVPAFKHGELNGWIRRGAYVAASLAAVVLGAIFVASALKSWNTTEGRTEIAKKSAAPDSQDSIPPVPMDELNKEPVDRRDSLAVTPPNRDDIKERAETPAIELLEFNSSKSDKSIGQASPTVVSNMTTERIATEAMRNADIVSVIDNQLSYLWNRVGLAAAPNVQMDVWLDRTAVAILGRPATAAEKEAFRSSKNENRVASYVDNLIDSSEFSRYWSTQLAEYYLGKRLPTSRDMSVSEFAFVKWLDESLAGKMFIGEVERMMISGPEESTLGSNVRTDPAAYWLAETMERTMTTHRDSVDQLVPAAKRRQPKEESRIGVARQLMRISGNPSMVCSQCHVDETSSSDLRGYISMSKVEATEGSSNFWSVPANLSGITLLNQSSGRGLRTEPSAEYFYEDGDGRMKLAVAGQPSLRKGEKGSLSLGEWFRSSTEPRRAIVELVWGQVFKQPLVPAMGLSEEEGMNERVDLKELLASQMQIRKADLGSLLRWITFSNAFRLEGLKTDTPWYLKSTELQIADSQRHMRLFAGFPASESLKSESGKLALGKVASWIDQKRSFQKGDGATLAQPANGTIPNKAPKTPKLDYSADQIRYLVSIEQPYSQLKALSERWAKSSMSWTMLLEHAYLATDARIPTRSERDEANKLFESTGKDRAKTLVMIVNARLGSW